jgi:hypothetical protein
MDPDRQPIDLHELWHPSTPNPAVSLVTGQLIRDLPPRRTPRERLRALLVRLRLRRRDRP